MMLTIVYMNFFLVLSGRALCVRLVFMPTLVLK